ncbi:hypothetical protein MNEG_13532 [Monoraphidium neglectum]|uniref:CBS domain-containing protein n=1 Tax=Monoraphidium neglectum TaxID=145388 RepID=A0A0D2MHA5_9CHLO|nr:hypothetical protein MNEG_13532 [Monoraphidium neglectum]KIY94430.1 hypothetical protein MNEG_13532 [Monoraphidium neglectum]|eukprot:XP_013893450.1 hypothetical protein MNEG_13532 [Monoraphidium neglectum]
MRAFVGLNLRHLLVVDGQNCVAGIITRKDLDHAAGHGWWRMSEIAPKPNQEGQNRGGLSGLNGFLDGFRKIPSYGFLKSLVNPGAARGAASPTPPPPFAPKGPGGADSPRAPPGALLGVGRDPDAYLGGGASTGRGSGSGGSSDAGAAARCPGLSWEVLLGGPVLLATYALSTGVTWALAAKRHKRERALLCGCSAGGAAAAVALPFIEAALGPPGVAAAAAVLLANTIAVHGASYLLFGSAGPAFPESYEHEDGGVYRGEWRGMSKEGLGVYT